MNPEDGTDGLTPWCPSLEPAGMALGTCHMPLLDVSFCVLDNPPPKLNPAPPVSS